MQKITPFLWFDTQAEEAANYYLSVFRTDAFLRSCVTARRDRDLRARS
jgi:predicted 3-demethylubiquinone-9 3-methyltransferase (glyoxalase superfamily)